MPEETAKSETASAEGQVVYRRPGSPGGSDRGPGRDGGAPPAKQFAPAFTPLIMGFALLLILIFVLGYLGVHKVEDTSRQIQDIEHQHALALSYLLQLRVALTRLDNEARARAAAEARHELAPPFNLRLSTARNEVNHLLPHFERAPLARTQEWHSFRGDLDSYFEMTDDLRRYSLEGFEKFGLVDKELNDILNNISTKEEEQIQRQREAMAGAAARAIRFWTLLAIVAGFFIAFATITEIQRRFRQLGSTMEDARREREFSNQMLEGMVSAIAAIDARDRIRSANPAFFKMFPQATIGASLYEKFASDDAMKMLEAATASRVEHATYRGRWIVDETASEHSGTFDLYSSPLAIDGEQGQILALVDVTEAAKGEAALRRSEALAAVGQATAQLAHEIKNPLGSIRLGVAMLRDNAPDPETLNTISLVERGIGHLNKLVVDVTEFSRERPLEIADSDLQELIESSIELVTDRIEEKQTPLELNYSSETIRGKWDADQLREVFVNLLANAIDASSPETPMTVSTALVAPAQASSTSTESERKALARIVISDRGAGIDAKTRARIFEPFFTTKKRGTGLGLAISRRIVERHGGTITFESEPGKGTRFTIDLPLQ